MRWNIRGRSRDKKTGERSITGGNENGNSQYIEGWITTTISLVIDWKPEGKKNTAGSVSKEAGRCSGEKHLKRLKVWCCKDMNGREKRSDLVMAVKTSRSQKKKIFYELIVWLLVIVFFSFLFIILKSERIY